MRRLERIKPTARHVLLNNEKYQDIDTHVFGPRQEK